MGVPPMCHTATASLFHTPDGFEASAAAALLPYRKKTVSAEYGGGKSTLKTRQKQSVNDRVDVFFST